MNIYENNKQLLTAMGGDSANLATDFEVRKAILDTLGGDSSMCSNIYEVDKQILNIYLEGGGGTGGGGTGGGEKSKVSSFTVNDSCIVDGTWNSDGVDVSNVKNMGSLFNSCISLQTLDLSGWDTSKVTNMDSLFSNCKNLQTVGDLSGWDVSNVKSLKNMFFNCKNLQTLDLSGWDTSNVTNIGAIFIQTNIQNLDISNWSNVSSITQIYNVSYNSDIPTYVGGRTIDEVISNNITIFNGLKVGSTYMMSDLADRASLRALINGLADLTGSTSQTLQLSYTLTAKLTTEDIAVATAKNWTIVSQA